MVVVILIIIIVAATQGKKPTTTNAPTGNQTATEQPAANNNPAAPEGTAVTSSTNPVLKDTVVVVPGANPITKDNKVVTQEGKPTLNDAIPMSPQAPQQTAPVDKTKLSDKVVKLTVTASGWTPNSFTVNANSPVSFAVTSGDAFTHVFLFDDPTLAAVAIGVGPGETRAITFNAPAKAGEYKFHCDVPGHPGRGEVGKMIVK